MDGWTGQSLRVNLTSRTSRIETFSEEFANTWIGGRGFAVKILYDELAPGIDPLGPDNKLVVAVGPISGIPAPNTGKTIVAASRPRPAATATGISARVSRTSSARRAMTPSSSRAGPTVPRCSPSTTTTSSSCRPTRSGARARWRRTTGSRPATGRASGSSTSARAARTWSASPSSAASRGGPAAGPAWAP